MNHIKKLLRYKITNLRGNLAQLKQSANNCRFDYPSDFSTSSFGFLHDDDGAIQLSASEILRLTFVTAARVAPKDLVEAKLEHRINELRAKGITVTKSIRSDEEAHIRQSMTLKMPAKSTQTVLLFLPGIDEMWALVETKGGLDKITLPLLEWLKNSGVEFEHSKFEFSASTLTGLCRESIGTPNLNFGKHYWIHEGKRKPRHELYSYPTQAERTSEFPEDIFIAKAVILSGFDGDHQDGEEPYALSMIVCDRGVIEDIKPGDLFSSMLYEIADKGSWEKITATELYQWCGLLINIIESINQYIVSKSQAA